MSHNIVATVAMFIINVRKSILKCNQIFCKVALSYDTLQLRLDGIDDTV
jgi:hypothetical protein